ncbi:RDD family protein [Nitrosopumilus oxyclinae]|uniref:RDD family protein n=1 Tax=Nitrosopumilus oxyclinae TaxID=1959104 RepID=A0A7D5M149_9ARCH|nr:RDD family protein [Nitrosopumilus oxyclinae]QLH04494.1 RDD family protein [Nitrosopumilus oxyclinae]
MSDPQDNSPSKIILAKWTDRFAAWLIDFIIISIISTSIIFALFGTMYYEFENVEFWAESIQYIPTSSIFFLYWVILEYKTGQTIGKKILNLKIVRITGQKADLKGIMISSFGKSFLLPIDIILGWILTNEKRQRIFNKIGDTIVVKLKEDEANSDLKYTKD